MCIMNDLDLIFKVIEGINGIFTLYKTDGTFPLWQKYNVVFVDAYGHSLPSVLKIK